MTTTPGAIARQEGSVSTVAKLQITGTLPDLKGHPTYSLQIDINLSIHQVPVHGLCYHPIPHSSRL